MKVGIIGVGFVGTSCTKVLLLRGVCHEIVLIDLPERAQHTRGVCSDLSHGAPVYSCTRLVAGGYRNLEGADVIVITAGMNEQKGGAIDRADTWGRQRLLPENARIYRSVVPKVVTAAPDAVIVVVTDPPDSLADVARGIVMRKRGRNPVLSAGTYLDTMRFRIQIASRLRCSAASVNAYVIGEHGKSQVYGWSSATVGGARVLDVVSGDPRLRRRFRREVERSVIDANIDIIEGTGASQHGIGFITSKIVEAILSDEGLIAPVGAWMEEYKTTLSLPRVIGRGGSKRVLWPEMNDEERQAFEMSAAYVRRAGELMRGRVEASKWLPL